ncbi:esterase family protein [Bacteroides sp. GM023]|nr:alpha/beta hydrolase-fold protein [Bacteroides sp. GM023]MBD3590964.1 esterase family protein [Bacteroides sp. GM023]
MRKLGVLVALSIYILSLQAQSNFQSRVVTDTVYSEVLKTKRAYTVYLPKSSEHNKEKSYPVLYLLHGMWEKNDVWANRGYVKDVMDCLTESGEACEMIIVTPDAGGGDPNIYQNGYFDMAGWKYETFFFKEFLPFIEERYRVIGDKQHRAIAGLSMGGGGATGYGQRHAGMFCAVYAMSALMDIPEEGAARFDDPNGKLAVLTRSVIEKSCVKYVMSSNEERKAELRSVAWFVDCGDDDFLLDRNIEFFRAMRGANIPCQFRVRDGGHTWEYWHSALYTCLPFVSRMYHGLSFTQIK